MYTKEKMKAKIHRAMVTGANLNYEGSITIGRNMLAASGIEALDRVQVLNINNGNRIETYVIEGEDGEICLNGAAAHRFERGDLVIIIAYMNVSYDKTLYGKHCSKEEYTMDADTPRSRVVLVDGTIANNITDQYYLDKNGNKVA